MEIRCASMQNVLIDIDAQVYVMPDMMRNVVLGNRRK